MTSGEPSPEKVAVGEVEVVLLSGKQLMLPIFEGDTTEALRVRAAEALDLHPCRVVLMDTETGEPMKAGELVELRNLQLVKMDLTLEGAWNVDISQGYSFLVTIMGSQGIFEGGSYGTWSGIQVDQEKATFQGSWLSGKYGSRGTLQGNFLSPKEGIYEAFFEDGTKVHDARLCRA